VSQDDSPEMVETAIEKLKRRHSHGKATVVDPNSGRLTISDGLQKEHSEKGRVKSSVYRRYLEASSLSAFAFFMIAIVLSQLFLILSNFSLRAWSENNRVYGGSHGITRYLALYGMFSLWSVLCMGIASTVLLLLCSLRSAKTLHDTVSFDRCSQY
jgi:ATP-binding cassette, subfamily C (CFTR/MRP), member 1